MELDQERDKFSYKNSINQTHKRKKNQIDLLLI